MPSYWSQFLACLRPAPKAPVTEIDMGGMSIALSPGHGLPEVLRVHPHYGSNLGRIAEMVFQKYPDLTVLDIGANVGDTAAIIRGKVPAPILCVEGCPEYLPWLRQNAAQMKDVQVEASFVGDSDSLKNWNVVADQGSARLVAEAGASPAAPFKSVARILSEHPRFAGVKLVKVDTDGLDLRVLAENLDVFRRNQSILYFEYDPHFFMPLGIDGLAVLRELRGAGYTLMLAYENTGDFLLRTELDRTVVEDLHEWVTGRQSYRYLDLALFMALDEDCCSAIRKGEIEFFRAHRREGAG